MGIKTNAKSDYPPTKKLSEIVGQTVTINGPIREVETKFGTSRIAPTSSGFDIWLPSHLQFDDAGAEGTYVVDEFESSYGRPGYTLRATA